MEAETLEIETSSGIEERLILKFNEINITYINTISEIEVKMHFT